MVLLLPRDHGRRRGYRAPALNAPGDGPIWNFEGGRACFRQPDKPALTRPGRFHREGPGA